jgi:hypothetical protein
MTDLAERFEPDPRAAALYNTLFEEAYKPLFPAVRGHLSRLAQVRAELAPVAATM